VAKLHVTKTNNNLSGAIDIKEENDEAIKEAASGGEELSQTTLYINNGIVEPIIDNNAGKRNDTADAVQGDLSGQVDAFSDGPTENQGGDVAHHTASSNQNKSGSWWRIEREEIEGQSNINISDVSLSLVDGQNSRKVHSRTVDEGEDMIQDPIQKRHIIQVPSLVECLGREGLTKLQQANQEQTHTRKYKVKDDSTTKKRKRMTKEGKVELAANGPGATGKLSGADESARQGP
jgi:hypothetical protein